MNYKAMLRLRLKWTWRHFCLVLYSYILLIGCVEYPEVNDFIVKYLGNALDTFGRWLSDSVLLNIATTLIICVSSWVMLVRRLAGKYNPLVLFTALFCIYQLSFNDGWEYVDIVWCVRYDVLLLVIAIIFVLVEIWLIYEKLAEKRIGEDMVSAAKERIAAIDKAGFAIDTRDENVILTGRDTWVKEVVERALKTDISRDSYAVGIAGGWGSGKTKFLKDIKRELGDTCKILEFNPWNCTAPEQITSDFFSLLSKGLNDNDSQVEKSIKKYVNILTKSELVPAWMNVLTEAFGRDVLNSLEAAKGDVQKHVASYPRKVAVLIDDIDRLEKNELFEVLRLIRVSANFGNMMFFVAYDRKYIVDMLKANEVRSATQYIKKIFQVEISLPDFEEYILPALLVRELKGMIDCDAKVMKSLSSAIRTKMKNGEYTLLRYLKNFRDIKRFASSFAINFSAANAGKEDFALVIREFFWIEILRYSDYDTYEKLRTTPYEFLETDSAKPSPKRLYVHAKGEFNSLNPDSKRIIEMLFGGHKTVIEHNSILMSYNFSNYFSYRVHEDKVPASEFYLLINDDNIGNEAIWNAVDKWCRAAVPKTKSLCELITNYKTLGRSRKECMAFLTALFALAYHCSEVELIRLFKNKLQSSDYAREVAEGLQKPVSEMLRHLLRKRMLSETGIAALLSGLHSVGSREYVDGEDMRVYKYLSIVPDDVLSNLACEDICRRFLSSGEIDITDITRKDSGFRAYLESMTFIDLYDSEKEYYEDHYVNLAFDALLGHFSGGKSKAFNEFVLPLACPDGYSEYEDMADELDAIDLDIRQLFGTTDNYRRFIDECFEVDSEIKEAYFQRYHL